MPKTQSPPSSTGAAPVTKPTFTLQSGQVKLAEGALWISKAPSGKDPYWKRVSNFTFEVLAGQYVGSDIERFLVRINDEVHILPSTHLASLTRFKEWLAGKCGVWRGSASEFEEFKEAVITKQDIPSFLYLAGRVGRYHDDQYDFWVLRDKVLIPEYSIVDMRKKLSITSPAGQKGTQQYTLCKSDISKAQGVFPGNGLPPSSTSNLHIYSFESKIPFYASELNTWIVIDYQDVDEEMIPIYRSPTSEYQLTTHFLEDFMSQLRSGYILYPLLGFLCGSIFLDEIISVLEPKRYPFFVLFGSTHSGKTSLIANCIKIFGIHYTGENYTSARLFQEYKEASQFHNLPIWRDEFRNFKQAEEKENFLRSVYNRSKLKRGDSGRKLHEYACGATLMFSGEDLTQDQAMARRQIKKYLRREERIPEDDYMRVSKIAAEQWPTILPQIIAKGFDLEVFKRIHRSLQNKFWSSLGDENIAIAALGGVFGAEAAEQAAYEIEKYYDEHSGDILDLTVTNVEQFFVTLDSIFTANGFYEIGLGKAKCLDYFRFKRNTDDGAGFYFRINQAAWLLQSKGKHGDSFSTTAIRKQIEEAYGARFAVRQFEYQKSERVLDFAGPEVEQGIMHEILQKVNKCQLAYEDFERDREQS